MRSPHTATKSSPRSPQLAKAYAQQRRPNAAKKKKKKREISKNEKKFAKRERREERAFQVKGIGFIKA